MKAVYNNFLGGLAPFSDRIGPAGSYAEARDIDIHRTPGYIRPGFSNVNIAKSTDNPQIMDDLLIDHVNRSDGKSWLIDTSGKIYEQTGYFTSLTNDSFWPRAPTGYTSGEGIFIYPIGTTDHLFYIGQTDIGRNNLANTFDDDYMSTAPAGAAALSSNPHPYIEGDDEKMYFGNGNDLASFDGQTDVNGTFSTSAMDIPEDWIITALFKTRGFLGICAVRLIGTSLTPDSRGESGIFYWDYVSDSFNFFVPIEDNYIEQAFNDNGTIYLVTQGRALGSSLRRVTNTGSVKVAALKLDIGGTTHNFNMLDGTNDRYGIDLFQNRLLLGVSSGTRQFVFAYGAPDESFPKAFLQPYSGANATSGGIFGLVKHPQSGNVLISYKDGTDFFYDRLSTGNSTDADWRGLYTEPEGKVQLNYVTFYFKTLVSSDDVTPTIETDDGTSHTLTDPGGNTNISFTNDGAVTRKRFKADIIHNPL